MRLSKSWIIAMKDFKTFRKKKNIIYAIVALPLIISIVLPVVVNYAGHKNGAAGIPATELLILLPAFSFFYIIIAAYIPTPIASYTLVGEKVEKSLEPLLATPTTDTEILLGKEIAAFIPPMASAWGGSVVFMVLMDLFTHNTLGYYYFPNYAMGIILLFMAPLAAIMSIQTNVIVSSKVTDVRSGQQLGALTILPIVGIYVAGELNIIALGDTNNLFIISGILLAIDVVLFFVTKATFRREEILTSWR